MKRPILVLVLLLALGSCSDAQCKGAKCEGPRVEVSLGSGQGVRTFEVEIAADSQARARGLMGRTEVPRGTGMLFLFPRPTNAGFWMKNTLVDLDIAFIAEGRVLEVRTMTPCRSDPCPLTRPSGTYDSALETAAGELASLRPGDPVTVADDLPKAS